MAKFNEDSLRFKVLCKSEFSYFETGYLIKVNSKGKVFLKEIEYINKGKKSKKAIYGNAYDYVSFRQIEYFYGFDLVIISNREWNKRGSDFLKAGLIQISKEQYEFSINNAKEFEEYEIFNSYSFTKIRGVYFIKKGLNCFFDTNFYYAVHSHQKSIEDIYNSQTFKDFIHKNGE